MFSHLLTQAQVLAILESGFAVARRHVQQDQHQDDATQKTFEDLSQRVADLEYRAQKSEAEKESMESRVQWLEEERLACDSRAQALERDKAALENYLEDAERDRAALERRLLKIEEFCSAAEDRIKAPAIESRQVDSTPDHALPESRSSEIVPIKLHRFMPGVSFLADPDGKKLFDGSKFSHTVLSNFSHYFHDDVRRPR